LDSHKIDSVNWSDYSYKPEVSFNIAYSDYAIYINYRVFEGSVLATKSEINSPVYKDSCVEFFVSMDLERYFNFEFNCIGTKYGGSGFDRSSGTTMSSDKVKKIRTFSTLGDKTFTEKEIFEPWNLVVEIPLELFTTKNIEEIKGSSGRANFYKCGDEMSKPHFISWNKIETKDPDFHRPEFFGQINFK